MTEDTPGQPSVTDTYISASVVSSKSSCTISCQIEGTQVTNALIDTGSTISLLNWQMIPLSMHSSIEPTPASVRSVTASPLTIVGTLSASMKINDMKFPGQRFIVAKNISFDAILGTDFLS